jgi:phosphatidylglycerophosphate synthase
MAELTYAVRDRSLLLPLYKRILIEPLVPMIPARVNPNAITHAGHLLNLAGFLALVALGSNRGGPVFFFAAAMVQIYNFCDNADGAHARRTGQTSAFGEFLDHGLDLFNAIYIATMAALAIGAPPISIVAIVVVVAGVAALTYWEQAESGVFQLGWLNQIESVFTLTILLCVAGVFGVDVFRKEMLPGLMIRDLLIAVLCTNGLVCIVSMPYRVWRRKGVLLPFWPMFGFGVVVFFCAACGSLSALAASLVGVFGYVFLGFRQLSVRLRQARPAFERGIVAVTLLLVASCVQRLATGGDRVAATLVDTVAIIAAGLFFGTFALSSVREGRRVVADIDRERATPQA